MLDSQIENNSSEQKSESEYGYVGEFAKESIYSDAHYTPAGEGPVPPRYYTPPEPKKTEKRAKSGKGGRLLGIVALCLVCALLGGLVGASFMGRSLDGRIAALEDARTEQALERITEAAAAGSADNAQTATPVKNDSAALTASSIYEQACEQVVGVTTEVTYTNFFGMNSSSAVSGTGFIACPARASSSRRTAISSPTTT